MEVTNNFKTDYVLIPIPTCIVEVWTVRRWTHIQTNWSELSPTFCKMQRPEVLKFLDDLNMLKSDHHATQMLIVHTWNATFAPFFSAKARPVLWEIAGERELAEIRAAQ